MGYGTVEEGDGFSGRARPQRWSFVTSGATLLNVLVLLVNVARVDGVRRNDARRCGIGA